MIKTFISLLNKTYLSALHRFEDSYSGLFIFVRIKKENGNTVVLNNQKTLKTKINISGKKNKLISNAELFENSKIVINGENNTIIIGEGVKLRKANIIIRGSNCSLKIGSGTTFGGIRIINVGVRNEIIIGENCLFADHIELWASDTHSIFDSKGVIINKELPIRIHNDVWVGSRVIILKGTTINQGAVIGMGTIVTKDVPSKTISVGTPNKIVKENISWNIDY